MGPDDRGARDRPQAAAGRYTSAAPDIDVEPPEGKYPISRGAPERKIGRVDRYDRRAEVIEYETLTATGTVSITFRVVDSQQFEFRPGHFIGIQADVEEAGMRKTPYCIVSAPNDERTFRLLVRLVPEGPLSQYLGDLGIGDVIRFRGPVGRSMIPKEEGTELVLLATGVGVGPFLSLAEHLFSQGFDRPIRLFWGLRLQEDICLTEELEALARNPLFSYEISLSQPPAGWRGLRGRVTESVPPLLETLGGKHFYLVGNGAMIEEMSEVLSDLGVNKQLMYEEPYFNTRYKADRESLARIRQRFVAQDLVSPLAHREALWRELSQRRRP